MPDTKLRATLRERWGNKCSRCGYDRCHRALQFHHIDSSEKRAYKSRGRASSVEIAEHPERFTLLCANCHFEEHHALDEASKRMVKCRQCGAVFNSQPHRDKHGRGAFCTRRCLHDYRMQQARDGVSIVPRFWKYANKVDDGCWLWTGSYVRQYPVIPVRNRDGRTTSVNPARVSYELHYERLPKRVNLVRSCGNPACVRPDHIVIRWSVPDAA